MEQPKYSGGLKRSAQKAEGKALTNSQRRLATLGFDPMESLVDSYNKICAEIVYQEKRRSGELVELHANGKQKAFNLQILLGLYEQKIAIGDKLLRYGYGRVPETNNLEVSEKSMLTINLAGGKKRVIGDGNQST